MTKPINLIKRQIRKTPLIAGLACRADFPDRRRDRLESLSYNPAVGPS